MKRLSLCSLLLCSALFSFAQTSIGVKGGINVNSIRVKAPSSVSYDFSTTSGFHVGAYFIPKSEGMTTFIGEVQFSRQGYKNNSGNGHHVTLNYLQCSFLFSYWPIDRLSIDVGPTFSCLLEPVKLQGFYTNKVYDTTLDIGVKAGIRGNVSPRISLIAQYYHGLTNIDEVEVGSDSIKEYNRVLSLGLGVIVNKVHN